MATSFHDAIKNGAGWVWALEIEGIPYLFVERKLKTTQTTTTATDPASGATVVGGLIVDTAGTITTELDRETGIGRGSPLKFTLHHDDLEDAGALAAIFGRPTRAVKLGADLEATNTTAITAEKDVAAAGFPSSGHVYLGKETIGHSGTSGAGFTGLTRGKFAGSRHKFITNSFSDYLWITDRPQCWRGRIVRLFRCLTSRSGHMLATQWLEGDYCRCEWIGQLDALPRPSVAGMELSVLPLERRLAQETGYTTSWEISNAAPFLLGQELVVKVETSTGSIVTDTFRLGPDDIPDAAIFDGTYSLIHFDVLAYQSGQGHRNVMLALMSFLRRWMSNELAEISTLGSVGAGSGPIGEVYDLKVVETEDAKMEAEGVCSFMVDGGTSAGWINGIEITAPPGSGIPWFQSVQIGPPTGGPDAPKVRKIKGKFNPMSQQNIFVGLRLKEADGWEDVTLPTSGIGVLEVGGQEELVFFSDKQTAGVFGSSSSAFVKLKMRGLANTNQNDLLVKNSGKLRDATLKLGLGGQGFAWKVALSVLQSSGGGELGDYDTGGLGYGCAIPAAYIDEASFDDSTTFPAGQSFCVPFKAGGAKFEDLFGGYLALSSACITQRYNSASNTKKLEVVATSVGAWESSDVDTKTITSDDVLLTGLSDLEVVRSPNTINLETQGIGSTSPKATIRDIPRAQLEGGYEWDVEAPGIELGKGIDLARQLIAYGGSFFALELPLGAWVDIEPGDRVILDLNSHPLTFDFAGGVHPMAGKLAGRCTGVKLNILSGEKKATVLLAGASHVPLMLAPTAAISGTVSTDKITTSEADGQWFKADDVIEIYDPGLEDSSGRITQRTIDSVSTAGGVSTFTLTTAFPAWCGSSCRFTHPPYATTTSAQKDFAYLNESIKYRWS